METERVLNLDQYKRPILTVDQTIDLMLCGKKLDGVLVEESEDVNLYNENRIILEEDTMLSECIDYDSIQAFHAAQQNKWFMPEEYLKLDVWEYVLTLCSTEKELERVEMELIMFEERGMFDLLRLLIYMVDHFRKHKYVWGVGRGSSVSSYCLYLIGVHKVDSIRYNLDIGEFLK